ncbi:MAG: hypothetical protein NTV51_01520 [Verrucomicrobia bacterium]|nr:hypothetical protein [Verrucomicrobiota bacterium]
MHRRHALKRLSLALIFAALSRAVSPAFGADAASTPSAPPSSPPPQVVLLKLDAITPPGAHGKEPMSPRWQKVAGYLKAQQIKGSFGIICSSLENDNAAYFKWIKDLQAAGLIEFWLHGYHARTNTDKQGEFEVGSAADQRAIFEKSEALAVAKLGFSLPAFGPHWSGTTDATDEAMAAVPALKIWLYGPRQPKHFKGLSIERIMALENPTFVPDPKKFREQYEKTGYRAQVLVLQGHPNQWTDERWAGFVEIVEFLRSKHVVFQTPSEYLASLGGPAAKK